jgi:methylated-DNA-[protein]-cysteine S-methyltransferase
MDYIWKYESPLGTMELASDGSSLIGAWFIGQKHFGEALGEEAKEECLPVFQEAIEWLSIYFAGKEPDFALPLSMRGTPFQKEVWDILLSIPYGHTITYGEIASILAKRRGIKAMSAQAIGNAVGRNPISIIVPCHRVLGARGASGGYAGGIARKTYLLSLEKAGK